MNSLTSNSPSLPVSIAGSFNGSCMGLIDIGNSNLKAAILPSSFPASEAGFSGSVISTSQTILGPVSSLHWLHADETRKSPPKEWLQDPDAWVAPQNLEAFEKFFDKMRALNGITSEQSIAWRISSVHPAALDTLIAYLTRCCPRDTHEVIDSSRIPMKLEVEAPERVGIDRLLAAWGAWSQHDKHGPLIVIQAGTAVTVDWIDRSGTYCGGAIMPGLTMSLKYMALGTAHLPWLAPPDHPLDTVLPGRNTQQAILAGASASFVGGIQHLVGRYRSRWNEGPVKVVVSGGDKISLSECLEPPYQVIDHLVLTALLLIDN